MCKGLSISNYNRGMVVSGNEFSWTGDNAMSAFGSMGNCLYANCSVKMDFPNGIDGSAGNQPRYTRVVGNLVRSFILNRWTVQQKCRFSF